MDINIKKSITANKIELSQDKIDALQKEYNVDLSKKGTILALVSTFGNVDLQGDVIAKNAFDISIQKQRNKELCAPINIDHKDNNVGVVEALIPDYNGSIAGKPGLLSVMKMFEVPKRNNVHKHYNSFSIEGTGRRDSSTGEINYIDLTAIALTNSPANPLANVLFRKSTLQNLESYQFVNTETTIQEAEVRINEFLANNKTFKKSKMYLYHSGGNGLYDLLVCDIENGAVVYNINLIQSAFNKFNDKTFFNNLTYTDANSIDNSFQQLFATAQSRMNYENTYTKHYLLDFVAKMNTRGDFEQWLKFNTDIKSSERKEIANKMMIEEEISEQKLNIETMSIEIENKVKVLDKTFLFIFCKIGLDKIISNVNNENAGVYSPAVSLQKSIDEEVVKSPPVFEVQQQIVLSSYEDIRNKYLKQTNN